MCGEDMKENSSGVILLQSCSQRHTDNPVVGVQSWETCIWKEVLIFVNGRNLPSEWCKISMSRILSMASLFGFLLSAFLERNGWGNIMLPAINSAFVQQSHRSKEKKPLNTQSKPVYWVLPATLVCSPGLKSVVVFAFSAGPEFHLWYLTVLWAVGHTHAQTQVHYTRKCRRPVHQHTSYFKTRPLDLDCPRDRNFTIHTWA